MSEYRSFSDLLNEKIKENPDEFEKSFKKSMFYSKENFKKSWIKSNPNVPSHIMNVFLEYLTNDWPDEIKDEL